MTEINQDVKGFTSKSKQLATVFEIHGFAWSLAVGCFTGLKTWSVKVWEWLLASQTWDLTSMNMIFFTKCKLCHNIQNLSSWKAFFKTWSSELGPRLCPLALCAFGAFPVLAAFPKFDVDLKSLTKLPLWEPTFEVRRVGWFDSTGDSWNPMNVPRCFCQNPDSRSIFLEERRMRWALVHL